jgi:ribulose-phosphate 3-epimerase
MVLGGSASCFDLYNLERQMEEIHQAPIDFIHFDVVDGRFNRCFILGLPLLETLRKHTQLPIEVHLAVYDPERYVEQFVRAGADIVSIHPEGTDRPMECFRLIRSLGARPALALRAETEPTEVLLPLLSESEYVVKLMVNPGFSGQQIQSAAFEKMRRLREMMDAHGVDTAIAADGNVHCATIPELARSGAEMLIGGTSGLFLKGRPLAESANSMLECLSAAKSKF